MGVDSCNFSGKRDKKLDGNERHYPAHWLAKSAVTHFPPLHSTSHRRTTTAHSFHWRWCSSHLRLVCSCRRKEERKRDSHLLKQRVRSRKGVRKRRRGREERHRKWRGCGVKHSSGSDLQRGLFRALLQSNIHTVSTCHRPVKTTAVPNMPITWDLTVWRRRSGKDRQVSWDNRAASSLF